MNDGLNRFDVDVDGQLKEWWKSEGITELRERFGQAANLYFVVLDPAQRELYDSDYPLTEMLHSLDTLAHQAEGAPAEDESYFYGTTGLQANVDAKLAFVLRTGLNSSEAQARLDLVEPGDFPHAGAGTYRGYTGGVSGLAAADDWTAYCQIIDKLIELRAAAAQPAIARSKKREPDATAEVKYLGRRRITYPPVG